jgi:hypothetical protein
VKALFGTSFLGHVFIGSWFPRKAVFVENLIAADTRCLTTRFSSAMAVVVVDISSKPSSAGQGEEGLLPTAPALSLFPLAEVTYLQAKKLETVL